MILGVHNIEVGPPAGRRFFSEPKQPIGCGARVDHLTQVGTEQQKPVVNVFGKLPKTRNGSLDLARQPGFLSSILYEEQPSHARQTAGIEGNLGEPHPERLAVSLEQAGAPVIFRDSQHTSTE